MCVCVCVCVCGMGEGVFCLCVSECVLFVCTYMNVFVALKLK